jgi:hypothetical protein
MLTELAPGDDKKPVMLGSVIQVGFGPAGLNRTSFESFRNVLRTLHYDVILSVRGTSRKFAKTCLLTLPPAIS